MKVTTEMIEQFHLYQAPWGDMDDTFLETALQAVLDVLDPIPANVMTVRDGEGKLWRRRSGDATTWRRPGREASIMDLQRIYGPLSWNTEEGR